MKDLSPLVVFGDSTTAPRGPVQIYSICLQEELSRRGIEVEIINAGVGGNSTEDARARFQDDVLVHRPALTVIQFGINDSAVNVWKDPPETQPRVNQNRYVNNLEYFIESLRKQNSDVILMTPNPLRWTEALKKLYGQLPYHPDDPDGFNVTLYPYVESVRQIARELKVTLVDVYAAFQAYGKHHSMDDLLLDGMHPNDQGHRLVADLLLPEILLKTGIPPSR